MWKSIIAAMRFEDFYQFSILILEIKNQCIWILGDRREFYPFANGPAAASDAAKQAPAHRPSQQRSRLHDRLNLLEIFFYTFYTQLKF